MKLMRLLLSCFFVLTIALGAGGCGKKADRAGNFEVRRSNVELQSSTPDSAFVTLQEAITEVKAVPELEGADEKIFTDLKAELERLLRARGVDKFPSGPPTYDPDNVPNLTLIEGGFQWFEGFVGDFDNDGWVRAKDLSPIAVHFGESADPLDSNYWKYAQYVDGNKNGIIDASDISAIAFHFAEGLGGYNIYEADDASGTNKVWVRSIRRPNPPADPTNPPAYISYADLEYNTTTGDLFPSPLQAVAGKFYMVAPFDRAAPWTESTNLYSSWVEFTGNLLPTARLTANPTSGVAPLDVSFDASASTDSDGTIVLYEFDFTTDGTYDLSGASPTAGTTYSASGNFRATVRVTDNDGGTGQAYVDISVTTTGNQFPVAVANANPTSGNAPLTVNFSATGSNDPDGTILLYEWDFTDDGTYDVSNGTGNAQFTYNTAGTYTARLRVTDNNGATGTDTAVVTVSPPNQPPVAVANANPISGDAPLLVNFSATGSNDPDGTIVLYEWDFTDDGTYDVSNATGDAQYTYNTAGSYTARLRVTDNDGATGTDTVVITVNPPNQPPVAVANANPTTGNAPLTVNFNATGSNDPDGTIVLYEWDFTTDGTYDVSNSTGDTQYTYNNPGAYTATLRVTDNDGAAATDSVQISVLVWNIETVDSAGNVGLYTSLEFDSSGNPAISYLDTTNSDLKFARWNGTLWNIETVDSVGNVGRDTSLEFDSSGNPAISYFDTTNSDLKFARWNGASWNIETVDSAGNVGYWTSLEFDSSGNPAISYFDDTNGDLKFARKSP